MTKKSEAWLATITTSSDYHAALAASLACETVQYDLVEPNSIRVIIYGDSASDLRAKFNSTMRSLRASSEALSSIQ